MKNQDSFLANTFYHIYNRTNNKEPLFTQERNYHFFKNKFADYIDPFAQTYAYCLLGNHFHYIIKVHDDGALNSDMKDMNELNSKISQQFRKFFLSYSKAFNKQEKRTGSLFQRPFKRVRIKSAERLSESIYYVHANPELHGLINDSRTYPWSSFSSYTSKSSTNLPIEKMMNWFGGYNEFIEYHDKMHKSKTSR